MLAQQPEAAVVVGTLLEDQQRRMLRDRPGEAAERVELGPLDVHLHQIGNETRLLDKIVERQRADLDRAIRDLPANAVGHHVVAEIKRQAPTRGLMDCGADHLRIAAAAAYQRRLATLGDLRIGLEGINVRTGHDRFRHQGRLSVMSSDVAADIGLKMAQQIEVKTSQRGIVGNGANFGEGEGQIAQSRSESKRKPRLYATGAVKQKARGCFRPRGPA